jgi:hypothetical protein
MRNPQFSFYALSICVAAAMLAGCGGSQTLIGAPGAMPQSVAPQSQSTQCDDRESWVAPEAGSQDLLYVSDLQQVFVYSYPRGKYEGTLLGFKEAIGTCVDQKGNVYIADDDGWLYEYAHGGDKRLRAIYTGNPQDCSVDRSSGNLAVTNGVRSRTGAGGVEILRNAHGKPKNYRDPNFLTTISAVTTIRATFLSMVWTNQVAIILSLPNFRRAAVN